MVCWSCVFLEIAWDGIQVSPYGNLSRERSGIYWLLMVLLDLINRQTWLKTQSSCGIAIFSATPKYHFPERLLVSCHQTAGSYHKVVWVRAPLGPQGQQSATAPRQAAVLYGGHTRLRPHAAAERGILRGRSRRGNCWAWRWGVEKPLGISGWWGFSWFNWFTSQNIATLYRDI